MKKLLSILIVLLLVSCDIMKKSAKTKTDTDLTEQIKTTTYRPGDTVTYEVPNYIMKDTTIYTVSREGTTLKTVYDQTGKISTVDCYSARISETQEINRRLLQQLTEKQKEKTEEVDSTMIYVIGGVIVLLFLIAIVAGFLYMRKTQTAIALLNKNYNG